jgi:hypothetical protein
MAVYQDIVLGSEKVDVIAKSTMERLVGGFDGLNELFIAGQVGSKELGLDSI